MARAIRKKVSYTMKNGKTGQCVLYDDGLIRIDGVRFSYPHLSKPYAGDDGGEPKFGVVGLLPKKTGEKAKGLLQFRIDELLKENKVKALASDKKFLRDGDESDKEEHAGSWSISARETRRPPLRNRKNEPVTDSADIEDVFQPGYWGSILIRPWFQNNNYGKRVNAGLSSAQMIFEDETFGEGRISDDDLDDVYESYDDDDEVDNIDDDDDEEIDI